MYPHCVYFALFFRYLINLSCYSTIFSVPYIYPDIFPFHPSILPSAQLDLWLARWELSY